MKTDVNLFNIKITPNHKLYFENKDSKTLFFKNFNSNNKLSYITSVVKGNTIKIPLHIDEVSKYNYLEYTNRDITYYCFINDYNYINENNTRITFTVDSYTTFMHCFDIIDYSLDRQHSTDNALTDTRRRYETFTEGLNPFKVVDKELSILPSSCNTDFGYLFYCQTDSDGGVRWMTGNTLGMNCIGIYYATTDDSALSFMFDMMTKGYMEKIMACYCVPRALCGGFTENSWIGSGVGTHLQCPLDLLTNIYNTFEDGVDWKIKTDEFLSVIVSNNSGSIIPIPLNYEYNVNSIDFRVQLQLLPQPTAVLTWNNNTQSGYTESIMTLNIVREMPITYNALINAMAVNSLTIQKMEKNVDIQNMQIQNNNSLINANITNANIQLKNDNMQATANHLIYGGATATDMIAQGLSGDFSKFGSNMFGALKSGVNLNFDTARRGLSNVNYQNQAQTSLRNNALSSEQINANYELDTQILKANLSRGASMVGGQDRGITSNSMLLRSPIVTVKTVKDKDYNLISEYFKKYGHSQGGRHNGLDYTTRGDYTFVKTLSIHIINKDNEIIPMPYREQIENNFNNGLTIWKDYNSIYEY